MRATKGIILAGGSGTRLYPLTRSISKQMLPIYDKPMIYYPMSVLMLAGIRDILIISTQRDIFHYKELLGDGSTLGISISYTVQDKPSGIAEAFILGKEFIGNDKVCLILGDNVFYGSSFTNTLQNALSFESGAVVFGYSVPNPQEYGVLEFDDKYNVLSIEEKPRVPKSNYAIPGLYFFDSDVVKIAYDVQPSARGELEITSVLQAYLDKQKLKVMLMGRGIAWLDTGTFDGLQEASNYISILQKRQGLYIACIEEIAFRKKYISKDELLSLAQKMNNSEYGKYLLRIANSSL